MPIKVMLVDDHAILRDGIQMLLSSLTDIEVVAIASDGRAAVEIAQAERPDVIVMDISLPIMNGLEATQEIKRLLPETKVIILTMHDTPDYFHRALRVGASGFVLKKSVGIEIIKAIRTVMSGHHYFGKVSTLAATDGYENPVTDPIQLLSKRELEVVKHIAEGKTSSQIAELLFLSPKSIETYRSRLLKKLGVDSIPALVRLAIRSGIISA